MKIRSQTLLLWMAALAGCAAQRPVATAPRSAPTTHPTIAATQPLDPKALLTLDQIQPKSKIPEPAATQSAPAPLKALQLYAQARAAQLENRRYAAISLLEKAIQLDP